MRRLIFGALIALAGILGADAANAAYNPPPIACTTTKPISINNTQNTDLITFTNNGYICAIMLVSSVALDVSVVQGTGTTCGTGTVALIGATTASATAGVPLAANEGWVMAADTAIVKTTTTGQHLCIKLSTATEQIGGTIFYVDAP